ncbi:unnamed protein product [Caretta caretta]
MVHQDVFISSFWHGAIDGYSLHDHRILDTDEKENEEDLVGHVLKDPASHCCIRPWTTMADNMEKDHKKKAQESQQDKEQ